MRKLLLFALPLQLLSACSSASAVEVAEEEARAELGCAEPQGRNLGSTFADGSDDVAVLISGCPGFNVVYRCSRGDFGSWSCWQTNSTVG